uniref:polynucleotide adenylyltransferase n=1 Tax=Meloidogyne enterolobii TaxID=390850 RepID=A0A6V7VFX1_MELEN|nr:unnamed protein product [Meloidogyne enterolobii]
MDVALNNAMNNSLGRVFPLSGYKSNLIIKELLPKNQEQKIKIFRSALILLKIWAKNNSIYGNQFGFLSGTSMLIMLTKIYLLYPNTCSVLVIIDRFYLTFLTWNWPRPFLIGTIDDSLIHSWRIDTELFAREITFLNKQGIEEDWEDVDKRDKKYIKMEKEKLKENEKGNIERLEKHSKLIMPILTPAYPQQSSAFNVNYSTMKIIKQTIIEGLRGLRQIRNLNEASHSNETLKKWIKGVDFVDKYNHFVTIICVGIDKNIGEDFCNFVKNRIRVELVLSLEEYPKLEYSHISPNKSKKGKCEKRLIAGKKFKKFW